MSVFGVTLVRIFPTYSRIRTEWHLSVFIPNARKCWKNADQDNFEQGHLLHSVVFERGYPGGLIDEQLQRVKGEEQRGTFKT